MRTSPTRQSRNRSASIFTTSSTRSSGHSGQRKPCASRGSNGDESESRTSPPPAGSSSRCALITAVGSPTLARSRRIAWLAKSCAATSRCATRPWASAVAGGCGERGSASTDTPGCRSCRASTSATGSPQRRTSVSRHGTLPGAASAEPTMKRRWTPSGPGATAIGAGGNSRGGVSASASHGRSDGSRSRSSASAATSALPSAKV